ncbi:hypothetical protein FNV43_RR21361 [Rhamnella rubrinervis]|uniref:Uncharacterized protein n=1 Tax=Rhamnella rubrinervis TaxID=2594499 RepID=A0A8K0GVB4_9ROSA|nr:hypothetical protein FNV43_RR21361 [Rhamnella rubrinervis]
MKASLLRTVSLHARDFLLRLPSNRRNPSHSFAPLAASTQLRVSFYSSETSVSPRVHEKDSAPEDAVDDDVNGKELKKRVEKFLEGDGEAIPSIFEAILERKLAKLQGKLDETDEDLMEKICGKRTELHSDDDDEDQEGVEHYSDESSDSDE